MSLFLASVEFGLVTAAVLAIASVGFTLQFGVSEVINLAYAAVMILGAFIAYWVNENGFSVWIGLLASVVVGAVVSLILNNFIYAPFARRGSSAITMVIVTLGMTLIIEFGVQAFTGGTSDSYTMSQGPAVGDLTTVQVAIIAVSVVIMAAMHSLLRYTKFGKAVRATAANQTLARNCGIRTGRVVTLTWALTGALSGLAGTVFAMDLGSFDASSADIFLVMILAAVFLGGPGQPYGAMLGAVVIGLSTEISAAFVPADYKYVIAFVVLLVMLAVRPSGLLGARE